MLRDLFVFAVVLLSLPASFRRPMIGLLVFSWLAYMRPQDLCWGFARTMRMSFFVGITMIVGWWAHERGYRVFTRWDLRTVLLLVLSILVTVSYAFAQTHDEYTNRYFFEYLKIVVIAMFTVGQVDTRERLRALFWTVALSLGFFGIKGGLGVLLMGSQILRGPGGMLEDNNDFALALVMNVPLLWYLGLSGENPRWVRPATRIAVALTLVTIVMTESRGGFLALCAVALWTAWRSGHLFRALGGLFVAAVLFFSFAPKSILDRLGTIGDTQESSAAARLIAWETAFRMIAANPVLGVGLRNFQSRYLDYSLLPPNVEQTTYVAHNSYLQVWAESGTPAFLTYLVMLASVFVVCSRVFRLGRSRPDLAWAANYARMMEATTIGFLVGAFFLNRGHFDLTYHWLALTSCLGGVAFAAARRAPAGAAVQMATAHVAGAPQITVGRRRDAVGRGSAAAGAMAAIPAPAGASGQVSWRRPGRWR